MLYSILIAFTVIVFLYGLYFGAIALLGILKPDRPNPYAHPSHRIAALIPARDEEQVIGYLVDSLMKQSYPSELYDVYVVVNNCSDDTLGAARRAGAKVLVCDREVHSKGEVLRFAFDALLEGGAPQYDAFCIFDADNLVDGGFLQAANNALSAGYMVAQGYRDSKNPKDNWVSGCTSVFFWFMSRLYNRSRANLGMTAGLNGTGIVIRAEAIRAQGFVTTTLTEDQEYTAQCALNGYKIGWMNDAVIYDEQPTRLKDSFTQRRRWGAGTYQCSQKYLTKLLVKAFREKNRDCFDIAWLFAGMYTQALSCMPTVLTIVACIMGIVRDPVVGLQQAYVVATAGILGCLFTGAAFVFIVTALEKKWSRIGISTYLLMSVYMITWVPANLLSLVTKPPRWTSIRHIGALDIDQCETDNGLPGETRAPTGLPHTKETGA